MEGILLFVVLVAALFGVDYYVYRNWRRWARYRRRWQWSLPVYRVLIVLMPLVLPLYLSMSRWYEVEPKLVRALVLGVWLVYYVPKGILALVVLIKDLLLSARKLFDWFKQHLAPQDDAPEAERLDLTDMKRMSRGEFLRTMGWTAATVPYVVVGYSVFRSLYDFEVHHVDVPVPGLPRAFEGLRIAQLSDLHAGSFFSERPMEEAVDLVHGLRPDLITITGDYVNSRSEELAVVAPALAGLQADLGVYGCLGNHDHYARVTEVERGVRETGVDLLVNQHRTLHVDGARLHVVGTDNTGFNQHHADLPRALDGIDLQDDDAFRLLLAHDPTFWDAEVRKSHPEIDLMLSGHTHGGQVGFEMGPVRWSIARTVYPRWAGLYDEAHEAERGRHHLYVNRGLSTVGPPLRLGIRPEITLLTLRRMSNSE